jgi:hypothetical protein
VRGSEREREGARGSEREREGARGSEREREGARGSERVRAAKERDRKIPFSAIIAPVVMVHTFPGSSMICWPGAKKHINFDPKKKKKKKKKERKPVMTVLLAEAKGL